MKKVQFNVKRSFKDCYSDELVAVVIKSDRIVCSCYDSKKSHKMRCIILYTAIEQQSTNHCCCN